MELVNHKYLEFATEGLNNDLRIATTACGILGLFVSGDFSISSVLLQKLGIESWFYFAFALCLWQIMSFCMK